jgi:hypothetical protein
MDAKLTLKLSSSVISNAKSYAKKKNTSLSQLVESYLNLLTDNKDDNSEITPFVKSLSGAIPLPEGYDEKKEYQNYLAKKYSK